MAGHDTSVEHYRREPLVILFTDLHEFSIVMEAMGESGPLEFLNTMYQRLGQCAVRRGGTIIKYLGDAMLIVFPANDPPAAALKAVECAREMRRVYAAQVEEAGISHETELESGIAYGVVERGVVGHSSSRIDDISGEEVNEGAMICHYRGIAITDSVHDLLGPDVPCTRLPDVTVKWRANPIVVWAVTE
jgi:adenylate cyclase